MALSSKEFTYEALDGVFAAQKGEFLVNAKLTWTLIILVLPLNQGSDKFILNNLPSIT